MVSIQSAWRAYTTRRTRDVTGLALKRRAAVCIQRAWRSILFLTHMRSLDAAQLLMYSLSAVTVVPNLCLTLLSARMLSLCVQRRRHCLPLHQLKWAFLESTGGAPSALPPTCTGPCPSSHSQRSSWNRRPPVGQRAFC